MRFVAKSSCSFARHGAVRILLNLPDGHRIIVTRMTAMSSQRDISRLKPCTKHEGCCTPVNAQNGFSQVVSSFASIAFGYPNALRLGSTQTPVVVLLGPRGRSTGIVLGKANVYFGSVRFGGDTLQVNFACNRLQNVHIKNRALIGPQQKEVCGTRNGTGTEKARLREVMHTGG